MANDYFDFLNQNSQQEKPNQEVPKEESVNLTTRADAECTVMCDGDFLELLAANQIVKIKVPVGQHILQFISTEYSDIVIEKVVDFPVPGKNHVLLVSEFQALISTKKEKEAEEARNRANAEVIESIQKLIEYDEEEEAIVLSNKISNLSGAIELLRKAAELGYAPAQYLMGGVFYVGSDVPEDEVEWLQKVAKLGLAPKKNLAEAAKWFRKAAEQGFVDAQIDLAWMYDDGDGVPEDKTEAARWYRKAAEQGNRYGQYFLATAYYDGEGVPQDYTEAAKWYRMAAEQGDGDAQMSLAGMYEDGRGVPKDIREAQKWYRKAAEQGTAYAEMRLVMLGG